MIIWKRRNEESYNGVNLRKAERKVQVFGKEKFELIAYFSTMVVTSLPSFSLSLSLTLSLSLSLSLSFSLSIYLSIYSNTLRIRFPIQHSTRGSIRSGHCCLMIAFKGEVRTINDRNICERRSCMKNNGKGPTFKFVSGEERRPSEVQRVSRGWRLPGATHSSADLIWIRKWLEVQAPELSEVESVELELGSCCSDFDKLVSDEICRTRKRHFEIPFRL